MTAAPASLQLVQNGASLADAIRWRILLHLQDVDVPTLCEQAGIDGRRLKDLLAEARPSAELVALVARFARVPVAEVMFGHSDESMADSRLATLTAATNTDLLQHLAGRLHTLEARIERALLALMEVEARLSAAGLIPSDLIPPDLIPLYASITSQPGSGGQAGAPRQVLSGEPRGSSLPGPANSGETAPAGRPSGPGARARAAR